jgi:hypothetical protein
VLALSEIGIRLSRLAVLILLFSRWIKQQVRLLTSPTPTKSLINSWWIWNRFYKPPRKEKAFEYEDCIERGYDQPVPKWFFLAGYDNKDCYDPPHERECTSVRYYDTVLIPVVSLLCSNYNKGPGYNNKEYCNDLLDQYKRKIYAYYDNKPYKIFRIESPNEFTIPGKGSTKYFADGYWVVIRNPKKGVHYLDVGVTDYDVWYDEFGKEFCPDVKYTLDVY